MKTTARSSFIFLFTLVFVLAAPLSYSDDVESQYEEAVQLAKEKNYDFAFMEFRSIMEEFPESEYAKKSMFAIGEYFYDQQSFHSALEYFTGYVKNYPDSEGAIFAKAYILKIMENVKEPNEEESKIIDKLKLDLFSKPLFLIFSEYKETTYKSAFQNEFVIRYCFNAIEVQKNGKIFINITP